MKFNIFSTGNKKSELTKSKRKHSWRQVFKGVRFRILVWYFLLTACTTSASILVTRQIFCGLLEKRSEEALVAEVGKFNRVVEKKTVNVNQISEDKVAALFKKVLSLYVPARNEFMFTLVDGQLIGSSQTPLPEFLRHNPQLVTEWANLQNYVKREVVTQKSSIFYVASPIKIAGETKGVVVAVRDATTDYQAGTQMIILVIEVTIVVLTLFFGIAWITTGRVLAPLRRVTETARSITESDMTQRISVQGSDEIAELTLTFNEMLDRLQSAFDNQQEFLKDAGHELRTPITVIQGHLELLNYRPERQAETIKLVMDELSRMNRLVNDLLLLAKSDRPDFLNPKPEELDWLTEELYLKARAIANRDWRLESKGLSPVVVDRGRLTQAVMNLIQNAVRHTQEGNTITLGSAVRNDYAYFWVRDTGEGIAPEDRERIFERFARATNSDRYSEGEGAGLGLSIVHAIAQAHNGWVELDSTLGVGSTFTMVFPIVSTSEVPQDDESNSDCRRQPPHRRVSRSRIADARIRDNCR
jgi:signal transduction histidine kinase